MQRLTCGQADAQWSHETANWGPVETHVDYISGNGILFNTEVVGEVGLLDSDYFAYVEGVDWCYRIKKNGYSRYSILVNPKFTVWHKGSVSTGAAITLPFILYCSNNIFMKKNAELRHLPISIIFSLYYFTRTFLVSLVTDKERAKSMVRSIRASFSKRV